MSAVSSRTFSASAFSAAAICSSVSPSESAATLSKVERNPSCCLRLGLRFAICTLRVRKVSFSHGPLGRWLCACSNAVFGSTFFGQRVSLTCRRGRVQCAPRELAPIEPRAHGRSVPALPVWLMRLEQPAWVSLLTAHEPDLFTRSRGLAPTESHFPVSICQWICSRNLLSSIKWPHCILLCLVR